MTIYWTLASIPELALLSNTARRHVWKTAYRHAFDTKQVQLGVVLFAMIAGAGAFIGYYIGLSVGAFIGAVFGALIGAVLYFQLLVRASLPYIRNELHTLNQLDNSEI